MYSWRAEINSIGSSFVICVAGEGLRINDFEPAFIAHDESSFYITPPIVNHFLSFHYSLERF
jgi:hypothetical protein